MIKGKHLINGEWVDSSDHFTSILLSGAGKDFPNAGKAEVDAAVQAAEEAFPAFANTTRETRAAFIDTIAAEIRARTDDLVAMAMDETGLPAARLTGETGRTTGQLELFAKTIRAGAYLDIRHDEALPDRQPLPRPDLRLMQRPIGPVAVFGASNFPLAFSVAGGDTASALAAGCPVVVKAHPAHPGTSDIVAQAFAAAIAKCGMPTGVFSMVQGNSHEVGGALVTHPLIKAVGFTGSLRGGKALFDLCAKRPEPIPFFGELGSINPLFMLPHIMSSKAAALGESWAASLTLGAGQFCTNPGVVFALDGDDLDSFVEAAQSALSSAATQTMLTSGIAGAYCDGADRARSTVGVTSLVEGKTDDRVVGPSLLVTTSDVWMREHDLAEEVFGPLGIVVRVSTAAELRTIARNLDGQLTCTLHLEEADYGLASELLPILERKAGRILANGFPTGVEVSEAMVHGGPYPASTNFGATSVGTMAIRRFLRPVCFQSIPAPLLPEDLRELS